MDEMRLINANEIPNFEYTAIQKRGDIETPCKFRIANWKDIADMSTIDPETLPIVRELREENQKLKDKLFEWDYWEGNTKKQILDSAKEDRAAVKTMRKHCEKTIADLRAELDKVTVERDSLLKELAGECGLCKHYVECRLNSHYCHDGNDWEWVGLGETE